MPRARTSVFTKDSKDPKLREQFKKFTQELVRKLNLPWKAPEVVGKPVQLPLSSMANSDSRNTTDSSDGSPSSSFTFSPEPPLKQAFPKSAPIESLAGEASKEKDGVKRDTNHYRREKKSLETDLVTACIRIDLKSFHRGGYSHAKHETARREKGSISFVAGKKR